MAVTRLGLFGTARQPYNTTIGFSHPAILLAVSVESASSLTLPELLEIFNLLAISTESSASVSVPALGQEHVLLNVGVFSYSEVGNSTIGGWALSLPHTDQGSAWSGLSETQTPSWGNVTETQTASWTDVDDSQP